ncbi:MAG: HK97 family phage prohead protease [Novosphingobium sp.]|nr:HK97 family phage prohead protease [Novosphingobium sp.]
MTRAFTGRFAGYAAIFGHADAGGDVIRAGAFSASLAARKAAGDPLPLFWQHRPDQPIGWVERVAEDAKGLRVIARLSNPDGTNAALLREGEVTGLSFGYRAREAREIVLPGAQTGRELSDIDIFEVSLVTEPMQPAARVHLVM